MINQIINNNCDGQGSENCTSEHSEVRVLPLGEDSNLILCRMHFEKEMNFRKSENSRLFGNEWGFDMLSGDFYSNSYHVTKWEFIKVYDV